MSNNNQYDPIQFVLKNIMLLDQLFFRFNSHLPNNQHTLNLYQPFVFDDMPVDTICPYLPIFDCLFICRMKSIKVYLNVYDFTDCNSCLSIIGVGGYHTGIQIDNDEYCYCVISTDPKESGVITIEPETANYHFNRKLYLGQAHLMGYKIRQIIRDVTEQFVCGKYHMFSYNCNHFSNALSVKLLGIQIPKWIFRATNILSILCCCLPRSLTNGQWALESLLEEQRKKQEAQKQLTPLL